MTWRRLHGRERCGGCGAELGKDTIVRRLERRGHVRCQPCAYRTFPYELEPPAWVVDNPPPDLMEHPWLKWAVHDWKTRQYGDAA